MSLSRGDKAQVKALLNDDRWAVVVHLIDQQIATWRAEEPTGAGAFETLRALHKGQGKVEGLKEFFERLEQQSFE